ncbi:hypothetical protein FRACYDRAFT_254385 [Fragilariopsis cylindrus CCMP1102]|uniref:Uncharacterized protein n=1 Tax=Fragilariopsis cylindrus CCMP1102 TaxID=635003 RepID=A0A1E7EKV9_9STRA|nr:hypothetical protein FRACYDRAFT_254385 [Fragilariopsis cylindrus CCMP1102]|eukprot:OEU06551.1 hypothetical protein FRACYDRAFT_254385 [Fragilariopsis cylindrus CCMP1102]
MIIRDKTDYVMTTATTLTALVKQQDSATSAATSTATSTTIAAVIKIQCAIRIFVSRNKRDELYIRHIKSQAKVLKKINQKEKNTRRLHDCAIIIQKNIRMYLIIRRCRRRQNILLQQKKYDNDKSKNREECLVLRRNINALKKQISDINVERRVDDDNNNRNYHTMDQKNRRRKVPQKYSFFGIESLQAEYRSLNIQNKTLDGILQPLQKDLNAFITENEQLKMIP